MSKIKVYVELKGDGKIYTEVACSEKITFAEAAMVLYELRRIEQKLLEMEWETDIQIVEK